MSELSALANLIRPDDSLSFKLFAQKVLIQEDARVTVEVNALVSTTSTDYSAIDQRIRAALNQFIRAEWIFSTIVRGGDAVGYERVTMTASARVPIAEIYNLEERARLASAEGLSLRKPDVNYAIPSARVTDAVETLRREITEGALKEAAAFEQITARQWRIGNITFGIAEGGPGARTGKGAYRRDNDMYADWLADGDDSDPGMTGSERITLVADVTLRARPVV